MDYAASRRVQQLVTSLTEPKASSLDDDKLTELKALLRQSEELVAYATPLLIDRLRASHSQARKLCVEVCAVLFSRSRRFRQLLSQQFTTLVELTVGHRSDLPLPGPPASAQALRARALEVIEEWHETWGQHYPQVTAAYRYLKKQYKFPEIASRAAAAAAEAAARMQRHQRLLLQRYNTLKTEFPQQRGQLDSLVQQIQECFQLLSEQPQQRQSASPSPQPPSQAQQLQELQHSSPAVQQQQPPGPAEQAGTNLAQPVAAEAAEADEQWEEVPAAAAAHDATGGVDDGGGDDLDMDELIGDYHTGGNSSGIDAELAARNASLLDQLSDLCRQAALAARQPLLEWLRLLTQVQIQEPQQDQQRRQYQQWQQERQGLLREVVRLRAQLQALIEEASTTWGVSVTQSTRRATAAVAETADSAPAAAAAEVGAAAPPADAGAQQQRAPGRSTSADLASLPSRAHKSDNAQQQQQQNGPLAGHNLTLGSSLQRLQHQQQRQQQAVSRPVAHDPYVQLRDPTVAVGAYTIPRNIIARNEELKFFSSPPDAGDMLPESATGITAAAAGGAGNTADKPAAGAEGTAAVIHKYPSKAVTAGPSSVAPNRKRPAEGSASGRSNPRSEVLKKLAASAPQLPISGEDWLLAEYGVNRHGMEVYNHWGAVDASVGLPKDRVGQLMGYAASYYVPKQQQQQQSKGPATGASGGTSTQPREIAAGHQQASKQTMPAAPLAQGTPATRDGKTPSTSGAAAAAAAGGSDAVAGTGAGAGAQKSAGGKGQEASAATPAASAPSMPPRGSNGSHQWQQRQPQRQMSHRQAASAHNRAVLAGAFTDEGIAAALQQQLNEEAAAETKERKKGRVKQDPERKVDKIRKHLLG